MSHKAFNLLLKTLPSNERDKLMKTAIAYGLTSDDPAWLILALNHSGLVSIESAIKTLHKQREIELEAFKKASEKIAKTNMEMAATEAIVKISDSLAKEVRKIHKRTELKITSRWFISAAVIGISFFITVNSMSYYFIKNTFYRQAKQEIYHVVSSEKNRASWANTEIGKIAYALSQTANIQQLATCNNEREGWKIVRNKNKRACFPYSQHNETVGWFIP